MGDQIASSPVRRIKIKNPNARFGLITLNKKSANDEQSAVGSGTRLSRGRRDLNLHELLHWNLMVTLPRWEII
jgi:hypothetical protein